jgi:hypothetical protein
MKINNNIIMDIYKLTNFGVTIWTSYTLFKILIPGDLSLHITKDVIALASAIYIGYIFNS